MIANLTGRESIPCAVALGKKSDRGFPVEKDRFHILVGRAIDSGDRLVRPPHPDFKVFNEAPPEMRRSIPCTVAHEHAAEFCSQQHSAYVLPGCSHPKKLPVCSGDGFTAKRWNGSVFETIACPGFECRFKQAATVNGREQPAPCKAQSKLVLRFAWHRLPDGHPFKKLPPMPFKFVSGGVNTATYVQGFLDGLRRACLAFGLDFDKLPLFGLPVRLEMHEKKGKAQRFPVAEISIDGGDPIAWIQLQVGRLSDIRRIAAADPIARLALTGPILDVEHEAIDDHELMSAGIPATR